MRTAPRRWRTAVIAVVTGATAATALAAAPAGAEPRPAADRAPHTATRIAMEQAVVAGGPPGITAAAVDGHGLWRHAAGTGDLRTGRERGADDRFRTASLTKTFTATVLLQLEAEGELDLDDTVEKWLPGVVRGNGHDGRRVTVRQLLNHTSRIFNHLEDPEFHTRYGGGEGFLANRYDYLAPMTLVGYALRNAPYDIPAGTPRYSNTNYVLAALIIEKVSGTSYERQIRERIIEPLELDATSNPGPRTSVPKPSARNYSTLTDAQPGPVHDVTAMNGSQAWGGGDVISDAADLNRFLRALLQGRLLPPEQLKAMKTLVRDPGGTGPGYGLGLETFTTSCGTTLWGHGGRLRGNIARMVATEDGRHSLAYHVNADWGRDKPRRLLDAEFCGTAPEAAA
ncbi:serine hydrolase domain-containing protein [Streptomyces sp. NPDC006798]|uniref:serine hydrolase domain-containing protein n=1 Tax=Streptomyces sp. NPDC006798 TaxID=3155462 RepID=UPI0033FDC242